MKDKMKDYAVLHSFFDDALANVDMHGRAPALHPTLVEWLVALSGIAPKDVRQCYRNHVKPRKIHNRCFLIGEADHAALRAKRRAEP